MSQPPPIDVVVVHLAATGSVGVRLIPALHAVCPECQVIVISPLGGIDPVLVELGAVVVSPTDLRPLTAALKHVLESRTTP
jgi:NADPH:quinone reductase-like Zn-dependent oxidoreductase